MREILPRAARGVRVEGTHMRSDRYLKIEADQPLPVQQVDYTPRARPGE